MTTQETKTMTLRMDEELAESAQVVASVDGSTVSDVIREALADHIDRRKADPEFQRQLRRNLDRHAQLLSMLADG